MNIKYIVPMLVILTMLFSACDEDKKAKTGDSANETEEVKPEPKKEFGLLVDNYDIIHDEVQNGQTLSDILPPHGLSYPLLDKMVKASKDVFDVRNIRVGKPWYIFTTKDSNKTVQYFVYEINAIEYVRYEFTDSVIVTKGQREVRTDTMISSGVIESSLWMSMKKSGVDPTLALELSDIYAWTIDFFGLQKGDSYTAEYEAQFVDSTYIGLRKIISVKFHHADKDQWAFLFTQDSLTDYFDDKGGSLRRSFLKAPLKFSRISSGFSNSRMHPVLKIRRPHHGVDYAAPRGTPVYAIGDGLVQELRYAGGYGKMVKIKHNGTYATRYAHLSKYGAIHQGSHVKQGEIIGYVGSTGMSTGPHLDFRFYKNGTAVNPLKVESPPALPVDSNQLDRYNKLIETKMILLNK